MKKDSGGTEQLRSEIKALRQQVSELQGIEQYYRQAEAALKACEERNRLLGDSAPLGIFTTDSQGTITGITRKMLALHHWPLVETPDAITQSDFMAMVPPATLADIQRCIDGGEPITTVHPHTETKGDDTHLRYYLSPIPKSDGSVSGVMGMVEDCTALKETEAALKESEARYRNLFQSAPVALIERDASELKAYLEQLRLSGVSDFREYLNQHPREIPHCWSLIKTVDFNQAFLDLMGHTGDEGPAETIIPIDSQEYLEMARQIVLAAAEGNIDGEREQKLVMATGEPKFVLGKSLAVSGHEKDMGHVVIALVDISRHKKTEETLRESESRFRDQAYKDNLTGLYNRRYLYKSLPKLVENANTADNPVSLIFMDLDHFKQVVDTHGHLNGSRAIREVGQTIDACLETPTYVVAYAGDEFVVVLPGMNQHQAVQKAHEIRSRMKKSVYLLDQGIEVRLQASFGIATLPQHATEINGLIAAADQALFTIKGAGKDAIGQYVEQ